ncbi:uroporphyrinogen decarboxylase [Microbacterium radiodurans]|uniref:uroporphyrinogen decarboxylase n=1 Tax=Microbacterium radiodurans TaxID=661398 RepID=UPI0021E09E3C|nr:uroporphyrinogen decarboxylase [Microbacterium radiodurans]
MRALLGERPEQTPVWFMRQAGRSLPEYRALRSQGSMLDACLTPELASEITLQPVRRHGVDAAIFFSDIIVPLALIGIDVEIEAGRGPVFSSPLATPADIARAVEIDPALVRERGGSIARAVELTTGLLAEESEARGEPLPLIGFAGAPFTLAAYLVEGGPSKDHLAARRLIHEDPAAWAALTEWLSRVTGEFLALQVSAGASAAQLFDSWAGALRPEDYRAAVLPSSAASFDAVRALDIPAEAGIDHLPLVHFGVGTGEILADMASIGVDALGVDYRIPLDEATRRVGNELTLQGNLDPALLFAPAEVRDGVIHEILEAGRAARAHVFNLGHGVPMQADPGAISSVVRTVHDWRAS